MRWSWCVQCFVGRRVSSVWLTCCVFCEHKYRNTKTGLHTDLLLTYDWQFRSPIILNPCLTTVLKPHHEPPPPQDTLQHTSQLLPNPSLTNWPYLLLQLTYLGLYYRPLHDIFPPALQFSLCGKGSSRRNNIFWGGHGELSVSPIVASRASGCLFVCVCEHKSRNTKTGLHTDLLLTYDWQFRSPISLKPRILKSNYESYYGNYNV